MQKAPKEISELGDYSDCLQNVYDVLNVVLATNEHRSLSVYAFKLVFCGKGRKSKGKKTLASIKLLSDLDQMLSKFEILIVIDEAWWIANPEKQEALLFHELCHLQVSDEGKLQVIGHDLEEFYAVLRRYGDWNKEIKPMRDIFEQKELFV
jgi:hypothetical protein